ncbi:MAG: DNA double-strand break repair nuclease NurA [Capsulimonadaceae bacterium]|nr:DNA double-strand break repair nuclease NurA [Capsulimonadaceae bacterium]
MGRRTQPVPALWYTFDMLELGQIVGELANLSAEAQQDWRLRAEQMDTAIAQATKSGEEWAALVHRIKTADTPWLNGIPIRVDQPIADPIAPPETPPLYTVVAADGSQIPLDRHSVLPYYVVNTGKVVIHYGSGERATLTSSAKLFYKEADLLMDGPEGDLSYIGDAQVSARRQQHETQALKALVDAHADRDAVLALADGTLILWAQEGDKGDQSRTRAQSVSDLIDLFAAAKATGALVASYLSRPRSREVVNALKVSLYPEGTLKYKDYPVGKLPAGGFSRLTDAALFERTLGDGQRSTVFESQSKVLDEYDKAARNRQYDDPDGYRIGFFYVNAGQEIARVETPLWIAANPALVDNLHALVLDQVRKGMGYPVALQEAHEQAIVRGPERAAFNSLIERQCIRDEIAVRTSRKALSKMTPFA